jgi:hypothetical protein
MTEFKFNTAERVGTAVTVCTHILKVSIFDLIHNRKTATMITVFSLAVLSVFIMRSYYVYRPLK